MATTKNFVPQIWAAKILRTLEDNLVAKKICNREYEGEIKQAGDTVKFTGLADPTISTYSGTVNYEELQDASAILNIDQQKYFAFKVSDIEKAQENVDKKGSQAERAAYKLKETADSYVMGFYTQANQVVTGASVTSANIISLLAQASQKLQEQNVPENDMWMVIPPWVKIKLQLAGITFQINNGINGTGGMAWTKELGFDVFVTNQVVNLGTVAAPQSQCMAGAYNAIIYADQIVETEALRLESTFADAVRGLHVYGGRVLRPNELVKIDLTYAAETTI